MYHESCKFSEPLSSKLWSLRKARKINSFSTPQDISKAREICESIKDTKLKDKCLEEQNLISFIPPIMQKIPSTYDFFDDDDIDAAIEYRCAVPYYYWRMDLELTPEQAQGTYQCQSGNLEDGFTTKTIIKQPAAITL